MTPVTPPTQKRIGQLDGLRACAILAVFLHHSMGYKSTWMGVDLFFILSGFLITGILLSKKKDRMSSYFASFYGKRVRRILPPYLLLLLVASAVFGTWWYRYWYMYFGATNFFQMLNLPQPEALGPLWSLAVEEQFYFVWPFVIFFCKEVWVARCAVFLIVLAPVLRVVCTPLFLDTLPIYTGTPFRMDLLASGALVAIVWRKRRQVVEVWGRYGLVLAALGFAGFELTQKFAHLYQASNTRWSNLLIYEWSLVICLGVFLWALSGWKVGILEWTPLKYIGRISYSMYLIHELVIDVLVPRFGNFTVKTTLIAFMISTAYAALSWHFIEKPIISTGAHESISR
ncbi:acyltransferase family protein [Terriglobus saanensis]|uniref:Acyltransferase 3 n=1 Tax=Terriglobus saanensis (strain ATCC BAA-1853 / DSM 23119 / SP1PR4) TaxID=401053 RepID=E8V094_TERSS|nr:acyltransferase [Terriglobus saanensis]ADV83312.1 acyltransferase 3 [Terriglobus saanensis SP1PR4]